MLVVDPWHWLEPDGTLPRDHPQLWGQVMQVAQAVAAGWDLPVQSGRPTLLLCSRRPGRKRCPGQLWVTRLPDDTLQVLCPDCGSEEMRISNWRSTPWAAPRPAPRQLGSPSPETEEVDLDELILALTDDHEDWVSYLDLATGKVLGLPVESFRLLEGEPPSLFGDVDLVEANLEQARAIQEDDSDRYVPIEPLAGPEEFAIMERYVAQLPDGSARRRLEQALRGKKPFRRFKDALEETPELRERWFAFRDQAVVEYARRWLRLVRGDAY